MNYVETLRDADIQFGKRLWQTIRKSKRFPFAGIFWLLEPDETVWNLKIASAKFDELGARDAFRELAEVTRNVPANGEQLLKIQLISPKDPLYEGLRSIFNQTASVEGVRLGHTYIGGVFIIDAYLYEIG